MDEYLNFSVSTATSQGDELSIKSLAENIGLILETVNGNSITLEALKSNIKALVILKTTLPFHDDKQKLE
jgi:hypothetical protein